MGDFDIHNFDTYRENNRLEVKAANGGLPGSLWDSYSSFANSYGGCIICGVKERPDGSWKTTGLQNLPKLKKDFWDTIHNKNKVSNCLITEADTEEYTCHGDVIFVIRVPCASRFQKPIFLNNDVFGNTWRRDHEGDYLCTPEEVKAMIRDSAQESLDNKVLEDRKISDFDKDTIRNYRIRYNTRHDGHPWTHLSDEDFLIRIGAAREEKGEEFPTAAGLLMFGQEYIITTEFPEYFLDYREKLDPSVRWTDRVQSQSGDWSGNVFDFFSMVYPKITVDFKKPFMTDGPYRVEETPKHLAVREAIANCLVNTDFYQKWGVVIEKYPEKIVLSNPGTILVGESQMLKGGVSDPRNKNVLKMFNLIGIGERAGSGVPDIFKVWREEKLDAPVIEEQSGRDGKPNRTQVTLPLVNTSIGAGSTTGEVESANSPIRQSSDPANNGEKLSNRQEQILSVMETDKEYSSADIGDMVGLKVSRSRQLLKKLVEMGRLESTGSTNGKRYIKRS